MEPVAIRPAARTADASTFGVTVGDGPRATRHRVRVRDADLARLAPGASAEDLLRFAFGFLLKHEPKEGILREFDLSLIPRYVPEFEPHARGRFRSR